jgi:hypothetical protein
MIWPTPEPAGSPKVHDVFQGYLASSPILSPSTGVDPYVGNLMYRFFGKMAHKVAEFHVRRWVHWHLSRLDSKVGGTVSQTFPLVNDETVGPFVCVTSIAVFEL